MRGKNRITSLWLAAAIILFSARLFAQTNQEAAELAKKTQNPVSDMISLPFKNSSNFGIGPYNRTQNVLNIQPVVPFKLNEKWNLITRTIIPVLSQPDIAETNGGTFGLGDINASIFFSPAKPGKIIWGAGPAVSLPTATNRLLGTGKWGIGPSVVALTMSGSWVIGVLANNVWSIAGDSERANVSLFLLQYFINFNLPGGWYLTSSPSITANWKADSEDRWTVPFGIGVGRIFHVGRQPMNAQIAFYYNAISPDFGPDWTLRVKLQFLFPKR